MPFAGTPLYERFVAEDRVLRAMPFAFYYAPYTVVRPRHYEPVEFYDQMIGIYDAIASPRLLLRRLSSAWSAGWRAFQILRVSGAYAEKRRLQELRDRIAGEPELLAFHQGKRAALPAFYRGLLKRRLGRYAELLSDDEVTPQLEPLRGLVQIAQ